MMMLWGSRWVSAGVTSSAGSQLELHCDSPRTAKPPKPRTVRETLHTETEGGFGSGKAEDRQKTQAE